MFKTLLRILAIVLLVLGIFWLVGTTWTQFKQDVDLKDPKDVFGITVPSIDNSTGPNITVPEIHAEEPTQNPGQSTSVENTSKPDETPGNNTPVVNITENPTESPTEAPTTNSSKLTKQELNALISTIRVSSEAEPDGYVRDEYEKPTHSYKLNGEKYDRNKYAWHISPYLISEDPFQYKCPYTELIITDPSTLDFEHIIPLHYVYLYGDTNWSKEMMNTYAYDQRIGMDVLNKANRSHSDKGPADWLPEKNISSYCYTWLVIAKQYNIALRQIDIDVCKLEILNDLDNAKLINPLIEDCPEYQSQQEWIN